MGRSSLASRIVKSLSEKIDTWVEGPDDTYYRRGHEGVCLKIICGKVVLVLADADGDTGTIVDEFDARQQYILRSALRKYFKQEKITPIDKAEYLMFD